MNVLRLNALIRLYTEGLLPESCKDELVRLLLEALRSQPKAGEVSQKEVPHD